MTDPMLVRPFDDYPIHQTAAPLWQPVSGDPNHYDRYFFHGYDVEAGLVFVIALGLYPTRDIIDAALCVSHGGVQRSVFASGRAPADRTTRIGPIAIEVVEPLRTLRVTVDAPDQGLGAELTFTARSVPLLEPRQRMQDRARVVMETCRYTQFGRWSGRVRSGETTFDCDPARVAGTRDRSWGVRPLAGSAPSAPPAEMAGIWWLWSPIQLDDRCVHLACSEAPDGARTLQSATILTDVDDRPIWEQADTVTHVEDLDHELAWEPGTRRASKALLTLGDGARGAADQRPLVLTLDPTARVFMRGAGYTHPEWGHGTWHGEEVVGGETLRHDEIAADDFTTLHVQQACRVTAGDEVGVGILEQLHIGPHAPSGLTGFMDPVR